MGRAVTRENVFANSVFCPFCLEDDVVRELAAGAREGTLPSARKYEAVNKAIIQEVAGCAREMLPIFLSFLKIHICVILKHCIRQPDGIRSISK